MTSCIFLVLRYTMNINNKYTINISNVLISIDVYTNWLFITLCFTYFDYFYYKIFGFLHYKCQQLWYFMVFGDDDNEENKNMNTEQNKDENIEDATKKTDIGCIETEIIYKDGDTETNKSAPTILTVSSCSDFDNNAKTDNDSKTDSFVITVLSQDKSVRL